VHQGRAFLIIEAGIPVKPDGNPGMVGLHLNIKDVVLTLETALCNRAGSVFAPFQF
jgi:hypothetical protein